MTSRVRGWPSPHQHPGVNNNLLAPGTLIDPISNNAAVNGIPVQVVPAGV